MSLTPEMIEKNKAMVEDFVNAWVKASQSNPTITVGEWLKTFAVMTGVAMALSDMTPESVEEALCDMADLTCEVLENSHEFVNRSTLQ